MAVELTWIDKRQENWDWQILNSQPRRVSLERSRVHHWNPHPGSAMLPKNVRHERTETKRKRGTNPRNACSEYPVGVKPSAWDILRLWSLWRVYLPCLTCSMNVHSLQRRYFPYEEVREAQTTCASEAVHCDALCIFCCWLMSIAIHRSGKRTSPELIQVKVCRSSAGHTHMNASSIT